MGRKLENDAIDQWLNEKLISWIDELIIINTNSYLLFFSCQNIFLGEDIRKQLPRESAEFDDVNGNWKVRRPNSKGKENWKDNVFHWAWITFSTTFFFLDDNICY